MEATAEVLGWWVGELIQWELNFPISLLPLPFILYLSLIEVFIYHLKFQAQVEYIIIRIHKLKRHQ